MDDTFLDQLTRDDLQRIAPSTTVVMPTGSTEQHSTHLPLCVDTLIASELAVRAARALNLQGYSVTVAPPMPYGFSHHHLTVGGALSIGISVYMDVMVELARSLSTIGFPRLVFINGHGGNDEALRVVANRVVAQERLPMAVAVASYWDVGREVLENPEIQRAGPTPGHAGGFETSCLLALRPELVRLDLRPLHLTGLQPLATVDRASGGVIRRPGLWEASYGCTDNAAAADAAVGSHAIEQLTGALVGFIRRFVDAGETFDSTVSPRA